MSSTTIDPRGQSAAPTEAEMRESPDAAAGLALVRARLARCTERDQDAFWEAVRRCFGSAAEPAAA